GNAGRPRISSAQSPILIGQGAASMAARTALTPVNSPIVIVFQIGTADAETINCAGGGAAVWVATGHSVFACFACAVFGSLRENRAGSAMTAAGTIRQSEELAMTSPARRCCDMTAFAARLQ